MGVPAGVIPNPSGFGGVRDLLLALAVHSRENLNRAASVQCPFLSPHSFLTSPDFSFIMRRFHRGSPAMRFVCVS
jgi:hypothetical protein